MNQIGRPVVQHRPTGSVERSDLMIRMGVRRHTRAADAHPKKPENHARAVPMFFTYYNFCRVRSITGTNSALARGVTDQAWVIEDLIGLLASNFTSARGTAIVSHDGESTVQSSHGRSQ